jgi:hypothetical protein
MGMRELESAILMELREVTGKLTLKKVDMLEWSTGEVKPETALETVVRLPRLGINVCVKKAQIEKTKPKKGT